jgi:hypothetical protein
VISMITVNLISNSMPAKAHRFESNAYNIILPGPPEGDAHRYPAMLPVTVTSGY